MDLDVFWTVIERSRPAPGSDDPVASQVEALTEELSARGTEEVVAFARHLHDQVERANEWRVWAAGYVAAGGMSDDAFLDFRVWLVAQGREAFERVLADPDALADLEWDEDGEVFSEAESLAYVPADVLEEAGVDTEDLDEDLAVGSSDDPRGEPFPEDDDAWFAARLPRLSARASGD
ncbi:DUF4240 domain-containing protein [Geodermatophilus sp. SYSU D00684]